MEKIAYEKPELNAYDRFGEGPVAVGESGGDIINPCDGGFDDVEP